MGGRRFSVRPSLPAREAHLHVALCLPRKKPGGARALGKRRMGGHMVFKALGLLVALNLPLPSGGAHLGDQTGVLLIGQLEGEAYSRGDSWCDPDFDGEHIAPRYDDERTNGYAFLPNHHCGIEYAAVETPFRGRLGQFRISASGDGPGTYAFRVMVSQDGRLLAQGDCTLSFDEWKTCTFTISERVERTHHRLRVDYDDLQGVPYRNLYLDYLTYEATGELSQACPRDVSDPFVQTPDLVIDPCAGPGS